MREGWTSTTLGDLCELTKGSTPTQKATPGKYPLVVTAEDRASSDSYQFDAPAVCVPMVSSTGHGHASLKRVHYQEGQFAVANIITACTAKPHAQVEMKFLWLLLDHRRNELIVPLMKGTANVSLSQKALATVPLAVPSLAEQRRIVDLIETVDNAIEKVQRVVGEATALRDRYLAAAFSEGAAARLGDLLTGIEGGRSPKGSDVPPGPDEFGVVKVSAVTRWGFMPTESKTVDDVSVFSERHRVTPGDVLITRANTAALVGQSCLVDEAPNNLFLCDKTLRLLPRDDIAPASLVAALNSPAARDQLSDAATGTSASMKNVSQADICNVALRWPENHAEVGAADQEFLRVRRHMQSQAGRLRSVRANLLTALLSGEHKIPESYDEMMEEAS